MRFNLTIQELKASEKSVYSQGGQDGVLEAIFSQVVPGNKRLIDIGARDGYDCSNTGNLIKNHGWSGVLIDAEPRAGNVIAEFVMPETINTFMKDKVYGHIDFMSVDIDGNDYWVWKAIDFLPKVISIEYNSKFKNTESYAIEYNPDHKWEGDDYYGASLLALKKLGEKKGYTLVYVVDRFDAVFIRNDLISPDYVVPTLDELLPEPIISFDKVSDKKWVEV